MSKVIRSLLLLSGLVVSGQCLADAGPYYLSTDGFCNVRKFYLTSEGYIYGKEVGCAVGTSTGNYTFTGYYGGGSVFSVSRVSSNNTTGATGLLNTVVYDLYSYRMYSYTSDGLSVTASDSTATYTFSVTRPSNAFASILPDQDAVAK
jgi:hypothetical protein